MRVLGELDRCLPDHCTFRHWGDRDPGGLRIYAKIAAACTAHGMRPHLMDIRGEASGDWLPDDLRAIEQIASKGGAAASLAQRWLAERGGRIEQEAVDPKSPVEGEPAASAGN